MSLKFHEGLEDMNSGDFDWGNATLDFRIWLPDETRYGDPASGAFKIRAAADVWNTVLAADATILQDPTHMSPTIPDGAGELDTDGQGLIRFSVSFSFTPVTKPNKVFMMFGKSFGAPDGDKIGYFYYDANDDVDNLIPFLAQGNLVTIATPSGLYQF